MAFALPPYTPPDFYSAQLAGAPDVRLATVTQDGVAPADFHSTSIFPEYFKIDGAWRLAEESRMDGAVVLAGDTLEVLELRRLKKGDRVILGRSEAGEEGIFVHTQGFAAREKNTDRFAFRSGRSRETAFSADYDTLYALLRHEREHGHILWVMGPAFTFDFDARNALQRLIEGGFVHGILAGNALAVHDLEGGFLRTALGQDIYTQQSMKNGHYNHLDTINAVRACGSIPAFIEQHKIRDGIVYSCVRNRVPMVLTGSIRDDGPLPEVVGDVYAGQDQMRGLVRRATTVICMATQLHTIATGNMTPSFRCVGGAVRPLYIYSVDVSEFAVNKLQDRGSLSATGLVTNVQDFIVNVAKGVGAL